MVMPNLYELRRAITADQRAIMNVVCEHHVDGRDSGLVTLG
jgi:hypothetical protein